jgi:hypothetical protein
MIFHTSGVNGMITIKEKVVIPSNNDVFEVGRERSVGILMEVILKNVDSVSSGVKRFTDVDGSVVKADELENIAHSRRKVL